jgi:hypothetical protein
LKQHLLITPLYVIETRFDELWYWPLWQVKDLTGTHRYYNGIYYGTDAVFTFEKEKRPFRLRQLAAYTAVVEALRAFSQKALSAEQQYDRQYFADENDFGPVEQSAKGNRYRWKLATGIAVATGTAALVFYAAVFSINSAAPQPKRIRLGALSPKSSSPRAYAPPMTAPTKIEEPADDPTLEPANGYVFRNSLWPGGQGTLTIKNGTTSGAIVKLVNKRLNKAVFTVFVAPNSNYKINKIPNDIYRLAYATGRRFNQVTDTFDKLYGVSVFEQSLVYETQKVEEVDGISTYYHTFEVTLQPVAGGNARTSALPPQSFEQF